MKKTGKHIVLALLCALCLAACARGPKVITRSKMVHIYMDMLVADEWAVLDNQILMQADTMLFYEPIFNKYGYDTEDFLASVDHYMKDPARYARILKKVSLQLEKKQKEITDREKKAHPEEEAVPQELELNLD